MEEEQHQEQQEQQEQQQDEQEQEQLAAAKPPDVASCCVLCLPCRYIAQITHKQTQRAHIESTARIEAADKQIAGHWKTGLDGRSPPSPGMHSGRPPHTTHTQHNTTHHHTHHTTTLVGNGLLHCAHLAGD